MAKRKSKPPDLVTALRTAIERSGLSHYRLSKDSGVAPHVIDRFMSGERDLRLATAAKLCTALHLELKPKP